MGDMGDKAGNVEVDNKLKAVEVGRQALVSARAGRQVLVSARAGRQVLVEVGR